MEKNHPIVVIGVLVVWVLSMPWLARVTLWAIYLCRKPTEKEQYAANVDVETSNFTSKSFDWVYILCFICPPAYLLVFLALLYNLMATRLGGFRFTLERGLKSVLIFTVSLPFRADAWVWNTIYKMFKRIQHHELEQHEEPEGQSSYRSLPKDIP